MQCCHDQLTIFFLTSYNSPEVYRNETQQINNLNTDEIVVPTVEKSGTQPSYSTSGNQGVGNGVEVLFFLMSESGRETNVGKEPVMREAQNRSRTLVGVITVSANDESRRIPTNRLLEESRPLNYGCNLMVPLWYQLYHKALRLREKF